jgi:hypothetical protein
LETPPGVHAQVGIRRPEQRRPSRQLHGVVVAAGAHDRRHGPAGVGLRSGDPDDSAYAVDARTGTQLWRFQTTITNEDDDVGAAPSASARGVNHFRDGSYTSTARTRSNMPSTRERSEALAAQPETSRRRRQRELPVRRRARRWPARRPVRAPRLRVAGDDRETRLALRASEWRLLRVTRDLRSER